MASRVRSGSPPGNLVRGWRPAVPGIREVFHARFGTHAYPPHTHDAWTLFIVDEGAIRYDLDRQSRAALPSMVSVLPPYVVHDGRPATSDGFRKRVLYLEPAVLGEGLIGAAVDRPMIVHQMLRGQVERLHHALECDDDVLEAETRLAFVAERLRRFFGEPPESRPEPAAPEVAEALREFLDDHLFERLTMTDAAERLGAGATRLTRAFSTAFGIPPHTYVLGRRLDTARDRILAGRPLADVALEVGFVDQAHLTCRFKRYLGATPGHFRDSAARSRWS